MGEHGSPEGAVARLLHGIVVDSHRRVRAADQARANTAPREVELQYQFEIEGEASATPKFETLEILFNYAFFYAPNHRESTLEEPHFNFGSKTNPPVGIHATVTQWLRNEANGSVIGAIVAFGAVGSGEFKGKLHLTFQGLATAIEEDQAEIVTAGEEGEEAPELPMEAEETEGE